MLDFRQNIFQADDELLSDLLATQHTERQLKSQEAGDPTILVVDDHRLIADSTTEILNRSGFRAVAAYDGRTALQMAIDMRPDFLLTDVMMPSMNGVELAIAVRRNQPETIILLFSGQAGTKDMLEQARRSGYAFELVAKPIHPEDLIGHLKGLRAHKS